MDVQSRYVPCAECVRLSSLPYVLTESLYHNTSWIRFDVEISLDTGPAQHFQYIVPFARQSEVSTVSYNSAKYSGPENEANAPVHFRPRSPLAPIREPKTPPP